MKIQQNSPTYDVSLNSNSEPLEFTGERMIPERSDPETFWEHIYRYKFALRYIPKKRVLDIACGEGYGTYTMSMCNSIFVLGIDISKQAVLNVKKKYRSDVCVSDCTAVSVKSHSFDVIVSFETLEHIKEPEIFIKECARLIKPGGRLIISTPNKEVYRKTSRDSTYHCSELNDIEFASLLLRYFKSFRLYVQQPTSRSSFLTRPLAIEASIFLKIKGFSRLRKILLNYFCPFISNDKFDSARHSITKIIQAEESIFSFIVNPYRVMPKIPGLDEKHVYTIAVVKA